MKKNLIILIPKGRNLLKILIYLKFYGIYIYDNLSCSRKMIYRTNLSFLFIIIIKNIDIFYYINNNIIDFVFLGKDLFLEIKVNIFYKLYNLYFFKFYLSLITNKNFLSKYYSKNNFLILYTKYINIAKSYFNFLNIKNIYYLKINSSSELSLIFKNSDLIIDIISSGRTVIENNLYKIFDLLELNNILLLNINILYNKFFFFFKKRFFFFF